MSSLFRKLLAAFMTGALLLSNTVSILLVDTTYAAPDSDGSANIDLFVTPTVPTSSLIGTNFTYDVSLENKASSDGDGYRPGFILSLPAGVNLVSTGVLGSPTRTVVHNSGSTLVFFETNQITLKGTTVHYPITLVSNNNAGVFVNKDIGILVYADDSIYGRGSAPSGSPIGTLTGGIDFAAGSGVTMPDTTDLSFPNNITSSSNLSSFPFVTPQTRFFPFDVRKEEEPKELIGIPFLTTLRIVGNSMGPLKHFHIQDVIPNNRAFSGIISVAGGTVGGTNITYDAPGGGEVTLDFTDISVPTSSEVVITYETIPLAYDAMSYSGGLPILDTGSVVPHRDPSPNTVTMHTGGLALVGGPYAPSTWNNGTSDILVNSTSLIPPKTTQVYNRYARLSKTGDISQAVIGDVVTYTISLDTAKNAAFTTNGTGTYIEDHLPDGLSYSGTLSSTVTSGTPLTFISATPDGNGDTTIIWQLNSGIVGANSNLQIKYQAVLDGSFQGAGPTEYVNTQTLVNDAAFYGTVGDGGLSGIWGMTDPSKIDTSVYIHATNADNAVATVNAPVPTMKKQLISITVPGGMVYDYNTGFPASIPPGSALRFALSMDFPRVNFMNPKIIDALPLLAGPNTSAYNIAFQTNPGLKDIYNSGVLFNTNDGVTPSSDFNGLNLIGTTIPNAPWISATPANNLEFQLNSGVGKKTFSILFTVDVLSTEPAGGVSSSGLVPLTNYAYSTCGDPSGSPLLLPVMDIPFTVNFPSVSVTKVASGGTNVEAGKDISYTITLTNTGSIPAFLENIIDTLPANMDFITGSIMASGSVSHLPDSSFVQSGNILLIAFDTGSTSSERSYIPLDNIGTPSILENVIKINYTVRPNTNFVIARGAVRTNTVTLDYYASSGALSNGVNNLGPVTANANVSIKSPTLVRSLLSTSETDSAGANLYVGEEVIYRTIITVPNGTFNLANYTETINPNLQFLSGTVTSYSGSLTFSNGTTFAGPTVNFGTITNNDTDPSALETIIIDTVYRVKSTAIAGTNYNNNGTFTYSSTSSASGIVVNVRKPTVTLTKSVSPTTGDAGNIVTYTITANNTSTTADAYDLHITDLLPSYLTYVTGSLSLGSYSGSYMELFTASGGGNGLTLDKIPVSSGASFSFQAILTDAVQPANTYTNRADLIYDTLDDDNSPYEWSGGVSATAVVSVPDVTLTHAITSTSLVDTTSALFSGAIIDSAIGEHIFYTTTLEFPESYTTGVTLTQTLPSSMKFLSGYILFDGLKSHTLSNFTISPNNVITFSLGDVDNAGIGAGTGITIVTEAVMLDDVANTAGSIKTSTIQANYSEKIKLANTFVEVVEPALSIVKDYSPNTGDAGDTIPVTITVTNTSLVYAYDVVLTDIPPSKLTPGVGFSGTINIGTLAPGQSVNYMYDSIVNGSANPGEILTGTASVIYTTHPGTPLDGERSYTAIDNDFVNIVTQGSIDLTLLSSPDVAVGNVSQYEIRVPVGEGVTNILNISSLLPPGMALIPSSVVIIPDSSITYSGTVTPVLTPSSDTIPAGSSQTAEYTFTGVNNSNTDNGTTEYIMIRYDAVVLNSTDINNGNTKNHSVTVLYDGSNTKSGASLPVTIREPNVILSVSNTYMYNASVPYVFTLVNTGTSTAYNLDLSTLLPPGVSYTGNISITNSGGAINLAQVGDSFTIDSLPVNPGNPLIFTINGAISESVPNFTNLTLTGTVIYTSEAGNHVSQTSNPLDTERTSGGGVNDYIDANKTTSFIMNIPLLDESISVLDLNGGDGIIGDIFEYTITLTNTGNVALTHIPVTLDIPSGFTGFVVTSIPPGSVDLSTSTGGVNSAGYLSLSGINIPIGSSVTLIYRVTALTSVVPGTTFPTTAQVGNSYEGAIGGTPSVPVTINAPKLLSTASEIDINGGSLLQNESIEHRFTLTNTGTATGTNLSVTLTWGTGSRYTEGTISFQSGTLINTGMVFIDTVSNTITFTISAFPPGTTETLSFRSLATGPIGTSISSNIVGVVDEGVSTSTTSNSLIIVDNTPGAGGSLGGSSPVNPTTALPPVKTEIPPKVIPPEKKPIGKISKSPLDSEYENYLRLKKRLSDILTAENTAGVKQFISPKVLPQTGKTILSRVKKLVNAKLNLEAPIFTHGGKDVKDDLSFWLTDVPKVDQSRDEYIVLPSNGMIVPITTAPKESDVYKKLISGREGNINTYLKSGVLVYPGTNNQGYGGIGNTVIFGHSSYWKSDDGRYKTHFQKIIELDVGEEVWVYKKQADGSYKRYRYNTTASYEVKPTDVSVLEPGIGKNLTLFTCTPIGNIAGRWVVKAKYIDEEKKHIEDLLFGKLLSSTEQKEVSKYLQSLKSLTIEDKKSSLLKKYDAINALNSSNYKNYFLMQIAKTYKELK